MKPFVFEDENTGTRWCFDVENPDLIEEEILNDLICDFCDEQGLETDFGVHDVSYTDDEFFGFTSYEVVENSFYNLMDVWRLFFQKLGYICGPIYKVEENA